MPPQQEKLMAKTKFGTLYYDGNSEEGFLKIDEKFWEENKIFQLSKKD